MNKLIAPAAKLAALFILTTGIPAFSAQAKDAQYGIGIGTQTGIEIGGQASGYHYQEHVRADQFFMEENGVNFGITGSATQGFSNGVFVTVDGRLAYGQNDYNGSGSKSGVEDFLGEFRLTGGKDFVFNSWSISPYIGLGYRNLYNKMDGKTDTNALLYDRDSQYLYAPIGITPRFRITDSARLSTNIEYDQLIRGWQTSYLSDTSPLLGDANNTQHTGYGIRGSVMLEYATWSVGPFANYWNVNQSDSSCNNAACGLFEPHNQTIEAGLQARMRF